jgi:hypothetical protein
MAMASVITNAAIVVFTSVATTSTWSASRRLWGFLLMEHGVLFIKYLLTCVMDDVPREVKLQAERNRFLVSKVILQMADEDDAELIRGNRVRVDLSVYDSEHDFNSRIPVGKPSQEEGGSIQMAGLVGFH